MNIGRMNTGGMNTGGMNTGGMNTGGEEQSPPPLQTCIASIHTPWYISSVLLPTTDYSQIPSGLPVR